MHFSIICSALLACAGLSSAAALQKRDDYTDSQIKSMWTDKNMVYDQGTCTWDGKCAFRGENLFGFTHYDDCTTGSCNNAKDQKCIKGWDMKARCPGGPHW